MTEPPKGSLQDALRAAAERVAADGGEDADAVMAEFLRVQEKDISRLTVPEWFSRFAYVITGDQWFDLKTRNFLQRRAFDALFRHVKTNSVHDGKPCRPSVAFDENRHAMGGFLVAGMTYAPGWGSLIARDGLATCNVWKDARQKGVEGDCTPWLNHLARLMPDEKMRNHVLNVLAFKYQRPNVKINHGLMLAGVPGCGKDSLFAPFLWAIGGVDHSNIVTMRNEEIQSGQLFNYCAEAEVMIVNELRIASHHSSRLVENFLKPMLAAPPEFLSVNKKHEHPYMSVNRMLVLAFSNEKRPIALPSNDRRWFVHWTDAPRMTEAEAEILWTFYDNGGREAVTHLFATRDVSRFNPTAPPMMTPSKRAILVAPEHDTEAILTAMARERSGAFAHGIMASPWSHMCRMIERDLLTRGIAAMVPEQVLQSAIQAAGWLPRGAVAAQGMSRRIVWLHPTASGVEMGDAELRRHVEAIFPLQANILKAV